LKILLVTNKCPPDYDGGYELRAFQIACALRDRGHEVDIVTSHFRSGFKLESPEPSWVHRIFDYVSISSKSGLARKLDAARLRLACTTIAEKNVPAMQSFLEGRSYDLAYCFGLHRISLASAYPLTERSIPILWHAGGTYIVDQLVRWPAEISGFRLTMNTMAKKWYDLEKSVDYSNIAFVSEFLRDYFFSHGMKVPHPYVISRGADFELQWDVDRKRAEPPTFFMASRVDKEKGIHKAVEAAVLLNKRRPDLYWVLEVAGAAGDESYVSQLHLQIASGDLAGRVRFLGKLSRDQVLAKMREATAFVSCSRYGEPFAGTIIETLASGTPLIGSIDGSIKEVVVDSESALLFEKDDAQKLSEHMETLLTDAALARSLALAGLKVIEERYTLDKILDQTETAFADVLSRSKATQKAACAK
jgi:glycosyltransferase involved in cell wall biosynthesis